jgi:hypothetical protein
VNDSESTPKIAERDHAFALEAAYRVSFDVADRTPKQLFWAMDRLNFDKADHPDGQAQRFTATQAIATELDRRSIRMRDPRGPSSYPGDMPI